MCYTQDIIIAAVVYFCIVCIDQHHTSFVLLELAFIYPTPQNHNQGPIINVMRYFHTCSDSAGLLSAWIWNHII